jgi:hypothetical protein
VNFIAANLEAGDLIVGTVAFGRSAGLGEVLANAAACG